MEVIHNAATAGLVSALLTQAVPEAILPQAIEKYGLAGAFATMLYWTLNRLSKQLDAQTTATTTLVTVVERGNTAIATLTTLVERLAKERAL